MAESNALKRRGNRTRTAVNRTLVKDTARQQTPCANKNSTNAFTSQNLRWYLRKLWHPLRSWHQSERLPRRCWCCGKAWVWHVGPAHPVKSNHGCPSKIHQPPTLLKRSLISLTSIQAKPREPGKWLESNVCFGRNWVLSIVVQSRLALSSCMFL